MPNPTRTGETIELLRTMIRNECVNDGTPESGDETRNADLLETFLEGAGLDVERYEPLPGRGSIVARIEGSDPDAPSLCLMGHTDVVPVSPEGWHHDPFGGELIRNDEGHDEVWGRGAIDMLNLTSSMAVAFRHLARTGFRPKGDLIYFGVADEEAGGVWGAEWMFDHHPDAVDADFVLTELGGWSSVDDHGQRHVTVNVGEKGLAWRRLRITGTPGHGSAPFAADNAIIKAAEIVVDVLQRFKAISEAQMKLSEAWRDTGDAIIGFVDADQSFEVFRSLSITRPKLGETDQRLMPDGYRAFDKHTKSLAELGKAFAQLGDEMENLSSVRMKALDELDKGGHVVKK